MKEKIYKYYLTLMGSDGEDFYLDYRQGMEKVAPNHLLVVRPHLSRESRNPRLDHRPRQISSRRILEGKYSPSHSHLFLLPLLRPSRSAECGVVSQRNFQLEKPEVLRRFVHANASTRFDSSAILREAEEK